MKVSYHVPSQAHSSRTKFKTVLAADAKQPASEMGSGSRPMRIKTSKLGLVHTNTFLGSSSCASNNSRRQSSHAFFDAIISMDTVYIIITLTCNVTSSTHERVASGGGIGGSCKDSNDGNERELHFNM
jgi:hypothetical protein